MRTNKPRRSLSQKVADKSSNRNQENSFSYLMLPDHAKPFKVKKEGNYRVDIIPYVAGANNRDTKKGELDYEFTFWIHRISDGDNNRNIVCPKKTYGKPCPICEQVEKLSRNYAENEDEIKALKAKQRELFNFVDPRDEEQTIMVYDTSYFRGFGQMLDSRLRNFDDEDDEDDDYKNFADIPGGRTLKIRFDEGSYNNNKFYAPSSIDFIERKEELDESIIDKAVCLDSCLKVLSYDQILAILAGTDEEVEKKSTKNHQDEEEEKPVRKPVTKKTAKVVDDEEDDEDEDEEEEKPTPKKSSKRSKIVDDEDEDDDEDEEEPPKKSPRKPSKNDDDDDEDDDEEEKPVKRSSKKVTQKEPHDEEDDDEEEEEEDDEEEEEEEKPVKKKGKEKKSADGKCPHGYNFGADCYIYSECDECEFVDECDAAQDNN